MTALATKLDPEADVKQKEKCRTAKRGDHQPAQTLASEKISETLLLIFGSINSFRPHQPGPARRLRLLGKCQRQFFGAGGLRGYDIGVEGEERFALRSGLPDPPDRDGLDASSGHADGKVGREILLLKRRERERKPEGEAGDKPNVQDEQTGQDAGPASSKSERLGHLLSLQVNVVKPLQNLLGLPFLDGVSVLHDLLNRLLGQVGRGGDQVLDERP